MIFLSNKDIHYVRIKIETRKNKFLIQQKLVRFFRNFRYTNSKTYQQKLAYYFREMNEKVISINI